MAAIATSLPETTILVHGCSCEFLQLLLLDQLPVIQNLLNYTHRRGYFSAPNDAMLIITPTDIDICTKPKIPTKLLTQHPIVKTTDESTPSTNDSIENNNNQFPFAFLHELERASKTSVKLDYSAYPNQLYYRNEAYSMLFKHPIRPHSSLSSNINPIISYPFQTDPGEIYSGPITIREFPSPTTPLEIFKPLWYQTLPGSFNLTYAFVPFIFVVINLTDSIKICNFIQFIYHYVLMMQWNCRVYDRYTPFVILFEECTNIDSYQFTSNQIIEFLCNEIGIIHIIPYYFPYTISRHSLKDVNPSQDFANNLSNENYIRLVAGQEQIDPISLLSPNDTLFYTHRVQLRDFLSTLLFHTVMHKYGPDKINYNKLFFPTLPTTFKYVNEPFQPGRFVSPRDTLPIVIVPPRPIRKPTNYFQPDADIEEICPNLIDPGTQLDSFPTIQSTIHSPLLDHSVNYYNLTDKWYTPRKKQPLSLHSKTILFLFQQLFPTDPYFYRFTMHRPLPEPLRPLYPITPPYKNYLDTQSTLVKQYQLSMYNNDYNNTPQYLHIHKLRFWTNGANLFTKSIKYRQDDLLRQTPKYFTVPFETNKYATPEMYGSIRDLNSGTCEKPLFEWKFVLDLFQRISSNDTTTTRSSIPFETTTFAPEIPRMNITKTDDNLTIITPCDLPTPNTIYNHSIYQHCNYLTNMNEFFTSQIQANENYLLSLPTYKMPPRRCPKPPTPEHAKSDTNTSTTTSQQPSSEPPTHCPFIHPSIFQFFSYTTESVHNYTGEAETIVNPLTIDEYQTLQWNTKLSLYSFYKFATLCSKCPSFVPNPDSTLTTKSSITSTPTSITSLINATTTTTSTNSPTTNNTFIQFAPHPLSHLTPPSCPTPVLPPHLNYQSTASQSNASSWPSNPNPQSIFSSHYNNNPQLYPKFTSRHHLSILESELNLSADTHSVQVPNQTMPDQSIGNIYILNLNSLKDDDIGYQLKSFSSDCATDYINLIPSFTIYLAPNPYIIKGVHRSDIHLDPDYHFISHSHVHQLMKYHTELMTRLETIGKNVTNQPVMYSFITHLESEQQLYSIIKFCRYITLLHFCKNLKL